MWHWSLTAAQIKALELLQQTAMRIVFPDDDYSSSLAIAGVEMFASQWEELTERVL